MSVSLDPRSPSSAPTENPRTTSSLSFSSVPEKFDDTTTTKTMLVTSTMGHSESSSKTPKSHVFTSSDIRDLQPLLDTNTKVKEKAVALFDFDDTLAMTGHAVAYHLGGLRWREKLKQAIGALKKTGEVDKEAPLYDYLTLLIATSAQVHAVQPDIQPLIEQLKKQGYEVMVFTARGRSGKNAWYTLNMRGVDALTEEQMKGAGLCLSPTASLPLHDTIYKSTMIFCQNAPKETVLSELFSRRILDPEKIRQLIFVDDKNDAVQKIAKVARESGVPFVGMHYTAVEAMEKMEFDLLKSTIQLNSLLTTGAFLSQEGVALQVATHDKSLSPEDYFKNTLKQLHQSLVTHKLYKPFSTPAEFQKTVSERLISKRSL